MTEKRDLLDILVEIAEIMNKTKDVDSLLQRIIDLAKTYLKVKRVSVMLIENDKLKIVAAVGLNFDYSNICINLGEGISGKVAASGEEIVVNYADGVKKELGYSAKSYMCIPLKTSERVIGVLNVTDKENDFFTVEDVKIGKYIASQCALAVERFRLYEEEKRSEKLKLIGKFTASIAHDIKNLLNVAQGYLELLEIEISNNKVLREYVDSVVTELKIIYGLTLDVLDFSRNSILLTRERVRLSEFLSLIEKHTKIMVKFLDIKFEINCDFDEEIVIDKEKLFRVFMNLINNSVEALYGVGIIRIDVRKNDKFLIFEVYDNGIGIKKENLEKIFDPFFTSGKLKGTGLGLAVAKEIVKAHDGEIMVDSKEGEYTKFIIKLPVIK
ncbi:GAF domain-containing protein [Deferribacter autotrophicus]|uniref:histidine kinase n=1 Tax=Deferribacter autotrophicus TaxID=500465 RepID=A0A5A8F8Q2_9BACT|nr:GAF domain-containing sensor histidine kinase [Deferribacter autotrophicus]KAA0258842.1 GAF domain-containing protein [Deferribacter autotrophicus]